MTSKKPGAMNQPIGQFIRELRLLTGLTQEQFAASLGVTYPTISRWENGRTKPSPLALL
ncbi:helix-turn-helix transcriptional regulator [Iningainema tapete]|uniref:helix-turn-helix transcriptional regulator n=1 Tax=Iningainema tapete TaxID=2806730 RepID=UPI0030807C80